MAEVFKPSKSDIFTMKEQRKRLLSTFHEAVDEADDWLHAHEPNSPVIKYISKGFPAGFDFDIYPYGFVVTNRGVNSVHTSEPPNVVVSYPEWVRAKYKNTIDEDEKAAQEYFQGLSTKIITESTENPLLDMLIQQIGKGLGSLSYKRDYSLMRQAPTSVRGTPAADRQWEMFDDRMYNSIPWVVESLHPTHVLFDPDNSPPKDYIIERPISRSSAVRDFPDLARKKGWGTVGEESTETFVKYVEYCSAQWYACYVDEEPVTSEEGGADSEGVAENTLGHCWYQLAFSGFGDKDKDGRWERRALGNIARGISYFKADSFDRNWLKLIKKSFVPQIVFQSSVSGEDAREQTRDFDPSYPNVVNLGPTVTARLLEAPQVPNALIMSLEQNREGMENLFGPGLLSGQGTTSGEPASKYAARTEAARSPYRPAEQAAQQAWGKMLRDMAYDVKYEPEFQDGHGLSYAQREGASGVVQKYAYLRPEQIHEGLTITVDLSPMTPQDKAFLAEEAKQKQDAGWISTMTAMKTGGFVENVEREMGEILAGRYIMSDQFMMALAQSVQPEVNQILGIPEVPAPAQLPPPAGTSSEGGGAAPLNGTPNAAAAVPTPPGGPPPSQAAQPTPGTTAAAFGEAQGAYRTPNIVPMSGGGY